MKNYASNSFVSSSTALDLSTGHTSGKTENKRTSQHPEYKVFIKNLNCWLFDEDHESLTADLEKH
jgi:hypothetical protein